MTNQVPLHGNGSIPEAELPMNTFEHSPIDYDVIRNSLDFANLTPPHFVAADSGGPSEVEQEVPLIYEFSADYMQSWQALRLPPCSPPRELPQVVDMEQDSLHLKPYPTLASDSRAGCGFTLPPDEEPPLLESHPTFSEVADYVRTSLVPYSKHFDKVYGHIVEVRESLLALKETSSANGAIFCAKVADLWHHLSNMSRELEEADRFLVKDISDSRDKFNELVGRFLPDSFCAIQQQFQSLFSQCANRLLDSEKRIQEVTPLVEQNARYCHDLYDNVQRLIQTVALLQIQVQNTLEFSAPGDSAPILELKSEWIQISDDILTRFAEFSSYMTQHRESNSDSVSPADFQAV